MLLSGLISKYKTICKENRRHLSEISKIEILILLVMISAAIVYILNVIIIKENNVIALVIAILIFVSTSVLENIIWYKPQAYPYYANSRSYVLPYIGVDSYGNAWLRLVFHYTGDSWIFFKKITVSVDGQNYVKDFDYFEVSRDNGSGDVWEYVDISPSTTDINMLRAIAASKETIVRFQSDDYHYDLTVKSSDKSAIISVLDAYSLL